VWEINVSRAGDPVHAGVYDEINPCKCVHQIKGSEVKISLRKVEKGKWPRLLKQKQKVKCTPAQETQSMREIRLLRGRLPCKGGGLTGMASRSI
jgi:aspartokinase-like uncharacterized kinase